MGGITDLGGALRITPAYVVTIGAWMMQSHRRVKSWPSLGFQGGQLRAENETYWTQGQFLKWRESYTDFTIQIQTAFSFIVCTFFNGFQERIFM